MDSTKATVYTILTLIKVHDLLSDSLNKFKSGSQAILVTFDLPKVYIIVLHATLLDYILSTKLHMPV